MATIWINDRKALLRHSFNSTAEHGIAAGRLALIHQDPFDRMLIAQAS
jgi:PIN domain nuclease of toxin-antitoxin system